MLKPCFEALYPGTPKASWAVSIRHGAWTISVLNHPSDYSINMTLLVLIRTNLHAYDVST